MHLAQHKCLGYTYSTTPGVWHYTGKNGEEASVRPTGQLGVNNGEALVPALLAGLGIAALPDFILGDALQQGQIEAILPGWDLPQSAAHFITPPGGPRPARVELLAEFLVTRLSQPARKAR
jgi:DNA-binding transcriptional LysR family regulator